MPIYEYLCNSCGKKFESLQKFSDAPLTVHDECGGQVERLISTSALQFKGAGWYVNDYAKGGTSKPGGETKTEGSAKTETKGDSKTESKSADSAPAATESKPAATSSTASSDSK
jgi:putative FmdB family regulatory protein